MSELSKLSGKGKKIKIEGIEFEIKPLSITHAHLFMASKGDESGFFKEILKLTLKDTIQDVKDEEINKMALGHIMTFMEAIMDVNKMSGLDKAKKKFLDEVKNDQK